MTATIFDEMLDVLDIKSFEKRIEVLEGVIKCLREGKDDGST